MDYVHAAEKALQQQRGLRYLAQGRSDLEAAGTRGQPADSHAARYLSNRLVMLSYPSNRSIVDVTTSAYSRVRPNRSVFKFLQYVEKQK